MSTAAAKKPFSRAPLLPPPEHFWKKYSPGHEFPVSSAISITLHVSVVGLLLLLGYLLQIRQDAPENKMPENVLVEQEGTGPEGGGGMPGLPGDGDDPLLVPIPGAFGTELDANPFPDENPAVPLDVGSFDKVVEDPSAPDFVEKLKLAGKEPEKKVETKAPVSPLVGTKPKIAFPKKGGGERGGGGLGGGGVGTGRGSKTGPGTGDGGLKQTSRQRYLASRWSFGLGKDPASHLDQLEKIGFLIGVEGVDGRFYVVQDLKRRPVELKLDNYSKYEKLVHYENKKPESIKPVAKLMEMPFEIRRILMFLPKEREEEFLNEEMRFSKKAGRPLHTFAQIRFAFEVRGGRYEPVGQFVLPEDPRLFNDPSVYAHYRK